MHSRLGVFSSFIMAACLLTSCGLLGNKGEINKLLDFAPDSIGCMNDAGPRVQAYYSGTIDPATWGATWDCATNSLTLFKKFVRTSVTDGYTQNDIRALLGAFLMTNVSVSPALVNALFELKASLFGGAKDTLTLSEIDALIDFLKVGKTESTRLIPLLAKRAMEPSPQNLLDLTDALLTVGDNLAAGFKTTGNPLFSWGSVQVFTNEIAKILHLDLEPETAAWVSAVKVLFLAGSRAGIEADTWPRLIRTAVSYGGPALAAFSIDSKYLVGPNATGQFVMSLAWKIKTSLLQTLDLYGGALPLSVLDNVIDALPDKWITMERPALKNALRPLSKRILQSRVPDAIDHAAIDLVFNKLDFWSRGQTHLERIFERMKVGSEGVNTDRFTDEATRYVDQEVSSPHKAEVYRLMLLARQNRPLFLTDDNQITFTPMQNHTLTNLSRFHWIRLAAEHLLQCYSSTPDHMKGTVEDLKKIVDDFGDFGRALHFVDTSIPDLHIKRFREANLFTFSSNGDQYIDADEATSYIAMLFSAATLSRRLREGTDSACPSLGTDLLGNNWKDPVCFKRELFDNFRAYWDHFPLLVRFYEGLKASDRILLQNAMETAARRYGISGEPIGSVDQDSFAGITQYIETLFARFDDDSSQTLSLSEAMKAYPVFKASLAELGHLDPNGEFLLNAVYTYMVKYGHAPTNDFVGTMSLVGWILQKPFWTLNSDRLVLFKMIGSISVAEPLPGANPANSTPKMEINSVPVWIGLGDPGAISNL
ncbi:hypothetical protein WDW37_11760 [Bdellovibrionota bacterium FG-1]